MTLNFFQSTHLKPSTYKTYNARVNTWLSILPHEHATLSFIYTHPNYSLVMIRRHMVTKNLDSPNIANGYIKAIMAAVKGNPDQVHHISEEVLYTSYTLWKDLMNHTYERANSYRIHQQPSIGQSKKTGVDLKLTDLITHRDELPDGSMNKLFIGFYTHIPPVRADYYKTEISPFGKTPTTPNYIFHDAEHSHLVITDFKTSPIYKQITHDLPFELHRQLTLSLQNEPRKYLFVNNHGEPFSRNRFSVWGGNRLADIFKKGLTLTMLRHIYISSLDLNSPPAVLIEIGKKMGHHITQQMLYKWRDSED